MFVFCHTYIVSLLSPFQIMDLGSATAWAGRGVFRGGGTFPPYTSLGIDSSHMNPFFHPPPNSCFCPLLDSHCTLGMYWFGFSKNNMKHWDGPHRHVAGMVHGHTGMWLGWSTAHNTGMVHTGMWLDTTLGWSTQACGSTQQ